MAMIHITDATYDNMANYIRENLISDSENCFHASAHCEIDGYEDDVDNGNFVAVFNGRVCVEYDKSQEMWGIDFNEVGASGIVQCSTIDESCNNIPNDFDVDKLYNKFCS